MNQFLGFFFFHQQKIAFFFSENTKKSLRPQCLSVSHEEGRIKKKKRVNKGIREGMRTYLRAQGRGGGNPPEIDVAGAVKYVTGCSDSNRQRRKGEGGRRWEAGESLVPAGGVTLVPAEGGERGR